MASPDMEDRWAYRAVWSMVGATTVLTILTYARLPPGATFDFAEAGLAGGLSRGATYLGFPGSIIALAVLAVRGFDRLGIVAALLCVTAFPFASSDLAAHPYDLPSLAGIALAVTLTLGGPVRRPSGLSRARVAAVGAIALLALPWLFAVVGLYARDVPLLDHVIRSAEPTPGAPGVASVHLGLHEGLYGAEIAIAALLLTLRPRRTAVSLLCSLLFVYGIAVAAEDAWHEQVVKRGITETKLPAVLHPAPTLAWAGLLACAALVQVVWFAHAGGRGDEI